MASVALSAPRGSPIARWVAFGLTRDGPGISDEFGSSARIGRGFRVARHIAVDLLAACEASDAPFPVLTQIARWLCLVADAAIPGDARRFPWEPLLSVLLLDLSGFADLRVSHPVAALSFAREFLPAPFAAAWALHAARGYPGFFLCPRLAGDIASLFPSRPNREQRSLVRLGATGRALVSTLVGERALERAEFV